MPGAGLLATLDACPTAAFILDAAGAIVHANAEARRLFYPHDKFEGLPVAVLLPDWPLGPQMPQCRIVDGSGDERHARIRTGCWQAPSGAMTTVFIEVERREQQEAPAADIRLRSILDMLPQAVCVFDAEDRYVLWNQKYAELYNDIAKHLRHGIPFEEILRISLAGDEMRELIEDKETWLVERMKKFRLPAAQEEQQLRDGRWLRHDDRRTPDGGAIGMRIDITDLKQREEWLGQLFDANPMPMLLCDGDSLDILRANQAASTFMAAMRKNCCRGKPAICTCRKMLNALPQPFVALMAIAMHGRFGANGVPTAACIMFSSMCGFSMKAPADGSC